ncbi:MAG: hypothetical protein AB4426_10430 [Xenococcaceae cyanobacterium]
MKSQASNPITFVPDHLCSRSPLFPIAFVPDRFVSRCLRHCASRRSPPVVIEQLPQP